MRILHCLRAPVGGLFRHVLDLAAEQARRGHDVGILADTAGDGLTNQRLAAIAPLLKLGIHRIAIRRQPGLGDFAAYRAVTAHARPLKLDVLHGHGAKGGAYARLARRSLNREGQTVAAYYTPHGGSLNFKPGTIESKVLLGAERTLEKYTSGLIFESAFAASVYAARAGRPRVPQRIIHNGVGPGDFVLVTPDPDARDVLFIGELRPIKGIDLLLDALASLNRTRRVTATIAGSGPDAEQLKSRSEKLGLASLVTFTGAIPAREAFQLGRVIAVPSLAESFPYVVLEAAAAGLPLIATSVGGIPEIVKNTDTALIEPGSTSALETALNAVLDDPRGSSERAMRLRANVEKKFTIEAMTGAVLDFYAFTKR